MNEVDNEHFFPWRPASGKKFRFHGYALELLSENVQQLVEFCNGLLVGQGPALSLQFHCNSGVHPVDVALI